VSIVRTILRRRKRVRTNETREGSMQPNDVDDEEHEYALPRHASCSSIGRKKSKHEPSCCVLTRDYLGFDYFGNKQFVPIPCIEHSRMIYVSIISLTKIIEPKFAREVVDRIYC